MLWKYYVIALVSIVLGYVLRGWTGDELFHSQWDDSAAVTRSSQRPKEAAERNRPAVRHGNGDPSGFSGGDDLAHQSGLEHPGAAGRLVVVPAALLENLSAEKMTVSWSQDLFSGHGGALASLQITDREKGMVQREWRATQQAVRKLQASHVRSERKPDGSVSMVVPDLSADLSRIGSRFYEKLESHLGENRAGALAAVNQLNGLFNQPGGETVYTVRMESVGNGQWRYHMSQRGPEGNRTWVGDSVPLPIRHLTDAANIQANLNPPGK
ncbi:MAG: hypothetical protein H7A51_12395 [Akkermansiaceae bacterium]|nr:hypothetical protein [Akkermansiaceae bacterium]